MPARMGPLSTTFDGIDLVDQRWRLVERAGIDVPGVVFFWRVFEGLQLVAAAAGGHGFELRSACRRGW